MHRLHAYACGLRLPRGQKPCAQAFRSNRPSHRAGGAGRDSISSAAKRNPCVSPTVDTGELVEPFPQLFGRSAFWAGLESWRKPYVIIQSLARYDEQLIFASFSAACVFGLPVSLELLEDVYLAVSPGSHTGKTGRFVRCGVRATPGIPTFARGVVNGIHVTSPEQTVVDCLCAAPFPQALAIADAALRLFSTYRAKSLCSL